MKTNKDFLLEDKSGRGYKCFLDKDDLLCRDNDEDWNDQLLHDFAEESEIGDVWQDRTMKFTRIAKMIVDENVILTANEANQLEGITLSADDSNQLMDAIWANVSPYLLSSGELREGVPAKIHALYEAYALVVVKTNWVPK